MKTPILIEPEHVIDAASIAYLNHATSCLTTVNGSKVMCNTRALSALMVSMLMSSSKHSKLVAALMANGDEIDLVVNSVTEFQRIADEEGAFISIKFAANDFGDCEVFVDDACYAQLVAAIESGDGGPAWVVRSTISTGAAR